MLTERQNPYPLVAVMVALMTRQLIAIIRLPILLPQKNSQCKVKEHAKFLRAIGSSTESPNPHGRKAYHNTGTLSHSYIEPHSTENTELDAWLGAR
ncbi:hypothetical protein U14_05561 [Candidatus Moduliflexus flocculans]|uniref:Uncharacterized protein n=1 Tax=Candidatus Moduliflexus flocculans TaxID=1499966 RepID=A0A081BSA1_9BACT|nr:hypothetical protein U14_05561 [Candidatus Moduliflexus flocculans]